MDAAHHREAIDVSSLTDTEALASRPSRPEPQADWIDSSLELQRGLDVSEWFEAETENA
jgi:hypothetical protein